ncbi:MAG: PD40 domain-containing protein [Flavobacteriales bacterium]|nr:PD40 domain-containing protein [Flavobacteriales bacterium]
MLRILTLVIITFSFTLGQKSDAQAQKGFEKTLVMSEGEDDLMADANFFFDKGNYSAATYMFQKLYMHFEGRFEYKLRLGICYTYTPTKTDLALTLLEEIYAEDPSTEDILYYLGKAYHLNHKFDEALTTFAKAKAAGDLTDEQEVHVEKLIINCNNGKEIIKNPVDIGIENLGPPVNSKGSEYVPVISTDESVLIYTYSGERSLGGLQNEYGEENMEGYYYEDVQISYKIGDTWIAPDNIGFNINTYTHDASIALSGDGQTLFIYKYTEEGGGDIYQSELKGNEWGPPVPLNVNINTPQWEGSASLSPDGLTLYFTSERPGGQGGKDIYMSKMRDDGVWDEAINLGPKINTQYDDDAPFIHPDGKTLFFSSNGHFNMGNYDVFRSRWDGESWSTPHNMGYPLNTAGDDMFYVVAANGKRAYFSSGRPGGMGEQDLYIAHLEKIKNEQPVILLKGKVTVNDSAAQAKITVKYAENNVAQGVYSSNASSGSYLISLPVGKDYAVYYEVDGYETIIKNVKGASVQEFKKVVINVEMNSDFVPKITIDGNVLYRERPPRPVSKVTIYIEDEAGTITRRESATDSKGYFSFKNVPPSEHYVLSIDDNDPELEAYIHPIIVGHMRLGDNPEVDKPINDVKTNSNGMFNLTLKQDKLISSNLPTTKEELKKVDYGDPKVYQEVLDRFGTSEADELIFKVQVGAYVTTKTIDFAHLGTLGPIDKQLLSDGLVRYTLGEIKNLAATEELKNKAIRQGQGDAFILIFYKGERRLLAEAVASGFFKPE